MKFHEAFREILSLYGFDIMTEAYGGGSMLCELMKKYHAFSELPALNEALWDIMSAPCPHREH